MSYGSLDFDREALRQRFERRPGAATVQSQGNGNFNPFLSNAGVIPGPPRLPSPFLIHPSLYRPPGPPMPQPRAPAVPSFNPFVAYQQLCSSYELPRTPPPPYSHQWAPAIILSPGFNPPVQTLPPSLLCDPPRTHISYPHVIPPRQPQQGAIPPCQRGSGRLSSIPIVPVDLRVRPENLVFRTQYELYVMMVSTFRPLAGVIGRIMKEELRLREQPRVKFDMYPIRTNGDTRDPVMDRQTASRAPMFKITIPFSHFDEAQLQEATDYLKNHLNTEFANPWHGLAGYVFRFSRRTRTHDVRSRSSFWVPPACVWNFSQNQQCYHAEYVELPIDEVEELEAEGDFRDESDGDQSDLVNDMWEEIRNTPYRGPPYVVSVEPERDF
ncbi:hypothetical protein F5Y05DRAFT_369943 [Hypoxylon sp. FL0543]|nr:hypothetical protein F5Y05DRAFT_369943 [Hypoxylon sp. FL0543]